MWTDPFTGHTPHLPGNLGLGVEGDGSDYHCSLYSPSKEAVSL